MSHGLFRSYRVLWMPLDYEWRAPAPAARFCCADMTAALAHDCDLHADPFDCPDTVLVYNPLFAEYGMPIRDGGMSYLVVTHCPWCGSRLPESQRDRWFDAVDAAGHADTPTDALPAEFLNGAWRTGRAS